MRQSPWPMPCRESPASTSARPGDYARPTSGATPTCSTTAMPDLDLLSQPAVSGQPGAGPAADGQRPTSLPTPASPMAGVGNAAIARMTEPPGIAGPGFPEELGLGNAAAARTFGGGNKGERGEAPAAGPLP